MPSTQRQHQTTRSQGQQQQMVLIDIDKPQGRFSAFSARHKAILEPRPNQQEDKYLCAWLRSRLEDGLWLIRQESALTATESDRRQVTRLAHKARALGLPVWPPRQRVRQEVA